MYATICGRLVSIGVSSTSVSGAVPMRSAFEVGKVLTICRYTYLILAVERRPAFAV